MFKIFQYIPVIKIFFTLLSFIIVRCKVFDNVILIIPYKHKETRCEITNGWILLGIIKNTEVLIQIAHYDRLFLKK